MSHILLVGEVNPISVRPEHALYPWPRNCSGERLQRLVMAVSCHDYLRCYDRVDLCTGKWSMPAARAEAARLLGGTWSIYLLLGRKVAGAFSIEDPAWTILERASKRLVLIPHPSGLCREWQAADAFSRAQELLRQAEVLPPRRP